MVEGGLAAETRDFAQAALLALSDKDMHVGSAGGEQKHVVLSYQWDAQSVIQRLNESLLSRGRKYTSNPHLNFPWDMHF